MARPLISAMILIAFCVGFFKAISYRASAGFKVPVAADAGNAAPRLESRFASSRLNTQTHAASVVELGDGRIRAFWFSGSREGAKDVEIHSAVFSPVNGSWSDERIVVTRENAERSLERYIAKLGNPVAGHAANGTLWLYFVTVSVGGWAGSSITAMPSTDEGATWGPARRLVTSPFLNISTLVKGAPFLYGDGTIGLPVYHEFLSKFGEILRFDKGGEVLDKERLVAGGHGALQPVVLVKNSNAATALMRHAGAAPRRVVSVVTVDGGADWSGPSVSALKNPDSALAAVVLRDGRLLAVLNDEEQGRDVLSLAVSQDGGANWKTVYSFEDGRNQPHDEAGYLKANEAAAAGVAGADARVHALSAAGAMCGNNDCRYEFSYPYLIEARNGDFHLVYTWNRSFIKHVTFNEAWLEGRIRGAQ